MKRTFTALVAVVVLLALAVPAGAAKGGNRPKPPPEPDPVLCEFDNDGVLVGWDGSARHQYRCEWIVEEGSNPIRFQIKAKAGGGAESIMMPYLAVTDVYPSGGDICERQMPNGQYVLPYVFEAFTLPSNGNCTYQGQEPHDDLHPNSFALTIGVQKVTPKGGKVSLMLLSP